MSSEEVFTQPLTRDETLAVLGGMVGRRVRVDVVQALVDMSTEGLLHSTRLEDQVYWTVGKVPNAATIMANSIGWAKWTEGLEAMALEVHPDGDGHEIYIEEAFDE